MAFRLDADSYKLARLVSRVRGKGHCFLKRRPICNDVIGWEDNHCGSMIAQRDPAGPQRDRGGSVAFGRLG